MLLVDHAEAQARHPNTLLNQSVSSHDEEDLAACDAFQNRLPIFGCLRSGEECGLYAQGASIRAYVTKMLLGQKLRRRHPYRLVPIFDNAQGRKPSDHRFAGANVALDKSLHRPRGSHILIDLPEHTLLGPG